MALTLSHTAAVEDCCHRAVNHHQQQQQSLLPLLAAAAGPEQISVPKSKLLLLDFYS